MDSRDVRALEQNQREAVFGCSCRVLVQAVSSARRTQLLQHVVGAFQLAREPGAGLSRRVLPSWFVHHALTSNRQALVAWPCPLNASELAELLAWPIEDVHAPTVHFLRQRVLAPPRSSFVPGARAEVAPQPPRILAATIHPACDGYLTLEPSAALHHLHVVGPTGAGKSTLLANLALRDIAAERAVVVIEPKGDLIGDLLDRIPTARRNDVVLLDPTDRERPVGLNVLAGPDPELRVDQLVHVLHRLYAAHWGPRTQDILHAGLLTLARLGGYTLIDLPVLLTDARLRRQLLPRLRGDRNLASFWVWFEALSEAERSAVSGPVMNKLRSFTLRSSIRQLLGQSEGTLDLNQVLAKRQILLVNLAKGSLGAETAYLLGALVMGELWQAILRRSALVPNRRVPAMVFVDEFQDYTHLPTDLGDALAQARGLGVGLTLAHQHLGQLTPDMRAAVLSNARSRVVFQTSEDAAVLARALGGPLKPMTCGIWRPSTPTPA